MMIAWISATADDVTLTPIICVLAEQVFIIWFSIYTNSATKKAQKQFVRLCPWSGCDFDYTGTNMASPCRNNIPRAEQNAEKLTPED